MVGFKAVEMVTIASLGRRISGQSSLLCLPVIAWVAGSVFALTHQVSGLTAAAVSGGLAAGIAGSALIRLSLALPHGACRGAGFLGLGTVLGGAGLVAAAVIEWFTPGPWGGRALLLGFAGAVISYLLGLLMLPGAAPTLRIRLRRALDGLSIGTSLFLTAWLLVIVPLGGDRRGPYGETATTAIVVALVASAAIAIIVLTGARASRHREGALACVVGATTNVLGVAMLTVMVAAGAGATPLVAATGLLVTGPLALLLGARWVGSGADESVGEVAESAFAGLPLLTVPVGAALLSISYHVITHGGLDGYSAAIALVVGVGLASRELFAVFDVRRYARRVSDMQTRFRSIVAESSDVTLVLDDALTVEWLSPSAARLFGLAEADVIGQKFVDLLHSDDRIAAAAFCSVVLGNPGEETSDRRLQARLRDGFGAWRDTESTISDQRSIPEVGGLVLHVREVGERLALERTLRRMSFADPLTGLPNRRELLRRAEVQRSEHRAGALLVVDLDQFAEANEIRGSEVGDAVLVEAAARLRATAAGECDLVARLTGDQFAVLANLGDSAADTLAARLLTALAQPYRLANETVSLSASIGLAQWADAEGADDVLRHAQLALRQAKRGGRNRVERYTSELSARLERQLALENDLAGAVGRGELQLAYQPVVALATCEPVGVVAVPRWQHTTHGAVRYAEFAPLAQRGGVVGEVDEWVLRRASRDLAVWHADGRDVWMMVPQQMTGRAARQVVTAAASCRAPADRLVIGLPARVDPELRLGATTLRAAGIRIATPLTALSDWVGAGEEPAQPDFVTIADGGTPAAQTLAEASMVVADRLQVVPVIEDLESADQVAAAIAAGCRFGRGDVFSRPLPAEHTEAFLEEWASGNPRSTAQ